MKRMIDNIGKVVRYGECIAILSVMMGEACL